MQEQKQHMQYQNQMKIQTNICPIMMNQIEDRRESKDKFNNQQHQELMLGSSKFIVYLSNDQPKRCSSKKLSTVRPSTTPFDLKPWTRNRNGNNLKKEDLMQERKKLNIKGKQLGKQNKYCSQMKLIKSTDRHLTKKQNLIDYIAVNKEKISKLSSSYGVKNKKKLSKIQQKEKLKDLKPKKEIQKTQSQAQSFRISKIQNLPSPSKFSESAENLNQKNQPEEDALRAFNQEWKENQQKYDSKNQEKNSRLTHSQIKRLFGNIHAYYEPQRDYLKRFIEKKDNQPCVIQHSKIQSVHKNLSQISDQCQIQISPSETHFRPMIAHYTFESDRALIVPYLKKIQTKKLYLLMMRQNTKKMNQRFRDQQFPPYYLNNSKNQKNLQYISRQKVYWSYYPPEPSTVIFSEKNYNVGQPMLKSVSTNSHKLQIVSFLCSLLFQQEETIKRLFEPPVNNVYCIWLFTGCQFEPVYIDGYFPLNQKMQHFYGQTHRGFWLTILIKCICKALGSYQIEALNKLNGSDIYRMLTGLEIHSAKIQEYESKEEELGKEIQKKLHRNYTCLLYNSQKQSYLLIKEVRERKKIIIYDPCFGIKQTVNIFDIIRAEIISILYVPPHENHFIYSNRFMHQNLSKLEIQCNKKTQIHIICNRSQKEDGCEKWQKKIYIYQCSYSKNRKKQMILTLKNEGSLDNTFKCTLKRGIYKVFYEAGDKKIHELFQNQQAQVNFGSFLHQQQVPIQKNDECQYIMTILSDQQIKISDCEGLQKKGKYIEDRKSMYYDPIKREQNEEQY